ncbi:VOC family protein [Actinopolymorpha sp. B11F2]|uniref:VOC family protein n=1 Tax=Actinopolymorpha sp. B11F2 TaxID=3160862 RepID=UPI0032E3F109
MIYELNHVGVRIRDLDESLAFWVGILGAKVVSEAFIPSSRTDCVYLQIADGMVELLRPAEPPPGTTFGLDHIAFMTDDLDGEHQRVVAAGAPSLLDPKVAGTGRGRLAFVSDPSGVRVELLQREEDFRVAPIEGFVRSLDHYSVAADDLDASIAFYGGQLGLRPVTTLSDGAGGTDAYLHLRDDAVELHHPATPADGPRIRHVGLRVDDVEAATDRLRTHGVPIAAEPAPDGHGSGRVAEVHDPDGVPVVLLDRDDLRERASNA